MIDLSINGKGYFQKPEQKLIGFYDLWCQHKRKRGIGYDSDKQSNSEKDEKPNTLQSHFFPSRKQNGVMPKGRIASKPKAKAKPVLVSIMHSCIDILHKNSSLLNNYGKANSKGPKKMWIPRDKIV